MTNSKLANIEKVLLMNTHPVLLESLNKEESLQLKMLIATYLKKDKTDKERFLKRYYKETKHKFNDKIKIMKDFNIEKDLNQDLLTDWEV